MYYVQAAPFVCFIITAFRIAQRWFGEWKIVLKKDEKPLEEGSIASVIEEAVVLSLIHILNLRYTKMVELSKED